MSEHLTDRKFWESFWRSKKNLIFNITSDYTFADLLRRTAQDIEAASAIELGGFPGYYSVFFKKHLGLQSTLFDYFISPDITADLLKANGLKTNDISIIEADLFSYIPNEQYDIVSSFGLIEHFSDTKDIIARHVQFLKPGGALFISLPNFKGVNGWVQKNFDPENYLKHNIACMNLGLLEKAGSELGLKDISVRYHGGFSVWLENRDQKSAITRAFIKAIWFAGKIPAKLFGFESELLSPYIVLQARKA